MKSFFRFILRYKKTAALVFVVFCGAVTGVCFLARPRRHVESRNPDVLQPVMAVEWLQTFNPKSVYFTLSAHDYLAAKKPGWISAHNTHQDIQDFFHAGQDGSFWRRLDHEYHFDAIMLCGDPSEFQPLLNYLSEAKDMTLVYLDHTSIIFMRSPAQQWKPGSLRALHDKFASYAPVDRACFLTMLASKLDAVGETAAARQALDESLALDKNSPDTWTQLAHNAAQTNDMNAALEDTARALKIDKNNYYALTTRVHLLEFMKRYDEALHASRDLLETRKDDPMVLYKHVMIAHEASAYTEEIETLKHLIAIVSAQKQPVAGFRVYLAQAYEMDGQAHPALDEFQKALDEGSLSEEQSQLIEVQMKSIKGQVNR